MTLGFPYERRLRRLAGLFVKRRCCPCCDWRGFRFEPFGNVMTRRDDARCPNCASLERHRAAFLLLRGRICPGHRVLHVAPEPTIISWLVTLSSEYLSVDLHNPAMQRMDLTNLELPDGSKTLVWCSHVLEHIPDDRKALSEIFRVLAPGGLLVLQVPISGSVTIEDASVVRDEDRREKYLQEDHVRLYGRDVQQRIEACGFMCETLSTESLPLEDQILYSVRTMFFREIFLCWRPAV